MLHKLEFGFQVAVPETDAATIKALKESKAITEQRAQVYRASITVVVVLLILELTDAITGNLFMYLGSIIAFGTSSYELFVRKPAYRRQLQSLEAKKRLAFVPEGLNNKVKMYYTNLGSEMPAHFFDDIPRAQNLSAAYRRNQHEAMRGILHESSEQNATSAL